MIIGTSLGCGCLGAGAPVVPAPVVAPAPTFKPKLVNPYNIMRSGRTPRWSWKNPRYPLTNIAALIRSQVHP